MNRPSHPPHSPPTPDAWLGKVPMPADLGHKKTALGAVFCCAVATQMAMVPPSLRVTTTVAERGRLRPAWLLLMPGWLPGQ